ADQHERRSDDDLLTVLARAAGAEIGPDADRSDVLDEDRRPEALADHDPRDLLGPLDAPGRADDVLLAVVLDVAGAGAQVVALEGVEQVPEGEPVGDESGRIGTHVILLDVAADRVDPGDAGNGLELWPDDPVLHGAEVAGELDGGREPLALGRQVDAAALPA